MPGILEGAKAASTLTESIHWATARHNATGIWCYRGFVATGRPDYRYLRLPDGLATLLVNLDGNAGRNAHRCYLTGLGMRPFHTASLDLTRGLCIYVAPWTVFAIMNGAVRWTAGGTAELGGDVPVLAKLFDSLRGAGGWTQVFTTVDDFFAELLTTRHPRTRQRAYSPEVARAWHALAGTDGRLTVKQLAAHINLGERHLETRFREQVGLTPKQCAQVFRFRRACGLLAAGSPLAAVAEACGYHDKAHLGHEFRAMSGLTPGTFSRAPHDSLKVPAFDGDRRYSPTRGDSRPPASNRTARQSPA